MCKSRRFRLPASGRYALTAGLAVVNLANGRPDGERRVRSAHRHHIDPH